MQSFAAVVIFVVCCSLPKIDSLGSFEIRLISFLNGTRKEFRPEFRLCLKEYQKIISHNGACTFGETTIDGERLKNGTRIDFEFAWPQSFTLITETWRNNGKVKDLIFHDGFQEEGVPSSTEWSEKTLTSGNGLIMRIAYRVVCGQYYYGPKCITFCRPRSNSMGNFECTENGTMRCMTGWEGKSCDIAQCDRCLHGFCEKPGVCRCKSGWTGDRCDQCVTYPGCKHGRCNVPNECICYVGWGGHFCNEDLNYCTSHSPCRNGATCRNTGHGQYTCECVNGYSGVNCENLAENCSPNTCLNDGVCRDMGNNYTCECPRGFSGRHCEYAVQSCGDLPCHNGGTCRPMWPEGFVCICPPGWTGKHCNLEVNPCHNQICQNGGKCIERYSNDVRKYECICPAGFTGNNCEHKAVECALVRFR
ncbi:hypothetical protein AB6A40_007054 [Gnathostoma spinigerum]|uniref:Delta-like protein n=1 Tax=Gnathostoma spinigerum TaxID=75299 RepID=A0ABD6EK40_9BILA